MILFYFEAILIELKENSKEQLFFVEYVYLCRLLMMPEDEVDKDAVMQRAHVVAESAYKHFQVHLFNDF